jgi:hypothetical protein
LADSKAWITVGTAAVEDLVVNETGPNQSSVVEERAASDTSVTMEIGSSDSTVSMEVTIDGVTFVIVLVV